MMASDHDPPPPPWDEPTGTNGVSLRSIADRLGRIEAAEERRAGSAAVLTKLWAVFGSLITAGAIALGGWVWSVQSDVNDAAAAIARNAERFEDHRAEGGPQGHPASVIERTAVNEGRIQANADGVRRIETRLGGIEHKVDQILERLPREGRR